MSTRSKNNEGFEAPKMSVAAVHRFGVTSFTSLRKASSTSNGTGKDGNGESSTQPKPKKFFKSRAAEKSDKLFDDIRQTAKPILKSECDTAAPPTPEERPEVLRPVVCSSSPPTYAHDSDDEKVASPTSTEPAPASAPSFPVSTSGSRSTTMTSSSSVINARRTYVRQKRPLPVEEAPMQGTEAVVDSGLQKTKMAAATTAVDARMQETKTIIDDDMDDSDVPPWKRQQKESSKPSYKPHTSIIVPSPVERLFSANALSVPDGKVTSDNVSNRSGVVEEASGAKKRSFFKNKQVLSTQKQKAVYKLRHWQDDDNVSSSTSPGEGSRLAAEFDDGDDDVVFKRPGEVTSNSGGQSTTSWDDEDAEFKSPPVKSYTIVRNVKQAHQVHEIGETQEFNDDIEYLFESVQRHNSIPARCLSVVSLASKCMSPPFRVHLRAHAIMAKFFSALNDAPIHQNLSLCVATLFFVLSQDRLTMDLEASTLALMLQLFESSFQTHNQSSSGVGEDRKLREKIVQLVEQMKLKGHAKYLNLENINAANLIMETLLSLTSRRAGDWFKEEMRVQGGITHIINTVMDCLLVFGDDMTPIRDPSTDELDQLRKIDRCLRVLENVTYKNKENQQYVLDYKEACLIQACVMLLELCRCNIALHNVLQPNSTSADNHQPTWVALQNTVGPGAVFYSCMLAMLRVVLNITHENPRACDILSEDSTFHSSLLWCVMQLSRHVPVEQRFDLFVLSLGIFINMAENSEACRKNVAECETVGAAGTCHDGHPLMAFDALVQLFQEKADAARQSETQTDEILTAPKDPQQQDTPPDDVEETIRKAISKAGKHMEHTLVCAYIALLLGCVVQKNAEYMEDLREKMTENQEEDEEEDAQEENSGGGEDAKPTSKNPFEPFIEALKKFHSFVDLTGVLGSSAPDSIQRIINGFQNYTLPPCS